MYPDELFRIRLKHLHIGTDNLLDIDPMQLAAMKKPSRIRVKHGSVFLDGVQLRTTNDDRKLYVEKSQLDQMGYTFVGDLLKLVNRGFVMRGKSAQNGNVGYIQLKAPSKPLKDYELATFDKFLIPCDYLFSLLGVTKERKKK